MVRDQFGRPFGATRISSNIRELEGTLIRVTAFANLNRQPLDMDLVQTVLKDTYSVSDDTRISPLEIIAATSTYFKITQEQLTGSGRQAAIALARQIAMHICRELTDLSLPKIGTHFGNRDHTTVMYATKKISSEMREKRYIYNQVSEIIQKITSTNYENGTKIPEDQGGDPVCKSDSEIDNFIKFHNLQMLIRDPFINL